VSANATKCINARSPTHAALSVTDVPVTSVVADRQHLRGIKRQIANYELLNPITLTLTMIAESLHCVNKMWKIPKRCVGQGACLWSAVVVQMAESTARLANPALSVTTYHRHNVIGLDSAHSAHRAAYSITHQAK